MNCSGSVKSQVSNKHTNVLHIYTALPRYNNTIYVGDFHFLWECARDILRERLMSQGLFAISEIALTVIWWISWERHLHA